MICAASQDPRSHDTGIFANTRLTQTPHYIALVVICPSEKSEMKNVWFVFECCSCFSSPPTLSLSWALIECIQTESDGCDHLEWHSPPPMMGWPGPGPHNTWWAHRDNYPDANTFFTLWHLQSSPDFLHQLSYIPCNVCYKIREKEMWLWWGQIK